MTTRNDFLVAGVDGSEAALEAARWAAAEAHRRRCELRLVHAYAVPATIGYPDYATYPEELAPIMREEGERIVGRLAVELRDAYPDLSVTTRVLQQQPVPALRSESEHALLTVVGSDHAGRFNSVLLGSVALAIASTNPAPVAVIHAGQMQRDAGPVVVGVDGTHTSDAAIAFGFQEASVRGTDLVAVLAWNDRSVPVSHRMKDVMDPARIEEGERALLAERTAGWADKYPDVKVVHALVQGRAVNALLDNSGNAQLLVVGSHGRGGFTGMLLGSTSHSLIIHSTCPVVVVRPGTD